MNKLKRKKKKQEKENSVVTAIRQSVVEKLQNGKFKNQAPIPKKKPANRRNFFDNFARSKKFNSVDAEKWYSISRKEILRAGGRGLFHYYNGSHIEALMQLYPELKLKKGHFFLSKKIWKARKFFDGFARSRKFNPLDAEKWYSVTHNEIIRAGGGKLLLSYNGSHIRSLMQVYPELMLKKGNFVMSKIGWKAPANQRNFFDGFARSKNFNPLDVEKWHSVTRDEIRRAGGRMVLSYYNGSHIQALVKLYPELMLKRDFLRSKGVSQKAYE